MRGGVVNYCEAIRQGFHYLLSKYPEVFVMGQGVWSPWYVGNSMTDLEKEFGTDRVIDTPVSESTCTGVAIGASLCGYRPIVLHPRIDFMVLATDPIVNQVAKWSHMLGGQAHPAVTVRGIINRGGEQGAQHSQALHSWYAHIPGLRVVMPGTVADARDLLIASVLCNDPVLYIDDRWLYEVEANLLDIDHIPLRTQGPKILREGEDVTLVGCGFTTHLCQEAAERLFQKEIHAEVVDLRVLNPLDCSTVADSVSKTGRLCVVDGGWRNCGLAGEVIASVCERVSVSALKAKPVRLTLPDAPAPTSRVLEAEYYIRTEDIFRTASDLMRARPVAMGKKTA